MTALTQRIVSEIEAAPEPVQAEVLDFVLFVKARAGTLPDPDSSGRIQHSPGVCGGEACIGMTRDAVWMLEEAHRAGVGDLELLKDYPGISVFDLEAAWQYVDTHHEEIEQAIRLNQQAWWPRFIPKKEVGTTKGSKSLEKRGCLGLFTESQKMWAEAFLTLSNFVNFAFFVVVNIGIRADSNENFPKRVVEELRRLGHDVLTSYESGRANQKIPDDQVLAYAHEQNRAVLTLNRLDFIRLHRETQGTHSGIIVCTRDDADPTAFAQCIHYSLAACGNPTGQLIRIVRPVRG